MSVPASTDSAADTHRDSVANMKLEVVVLPVSDVDRAKSFDEKLGWRLDAAAGATFESASDLEQALVRAVVEHAKHEQRTGEQDTEWPSWYARYMVAEQTGEGLPS